MARRGARRRLNRSPRAPHLIGGGGPGHVRRPDGRQWQLELFRPLRLERVVDGQLPGNPFDARRLSHLASTVVVVPFTDDGRQRLAVELERAHEVIDPPRLVWLFDPDRLSEVRGSLYGWRRGAPPRALVVWHEYPLTDRVEWLCEPFVRRRHE